MKMFELRSEKLKRTPQTFHIDSVHFKIYYQVDIYRSMTMKISLKSFLRLRPIKNIAKSYFNDDKC